MNRLKVNKVSVYIRSQNEFPFDVLDVQDEFSKVLGYYSLQGHLNWNEQDVLQEELLRLAEAAQTVEMTRMVHRELDLEGKSRKSRNVKIEQSVDFLDWLKTLPENLQKSFFSSLAVKASGGGGAWVGLELAPWFWWLVRIGFAGYSPYGFRWLSTSWKIGLIRSPGLHPGDRGVLRVGFALRKGEGLVS